MTYIRRMGTHIGFSGTQDGMTDRQAAAVRRLISGVEGVTWHHGDCVGADYQFHVLLRSLDYRVVSHPPTNVSKRAWTLADEERPPKKYLQRNRDIVDETSVMIFAPKSFDEELRSGTWATYRYASKVGKPWIIVFPDGTTTRSCQLTICSLCGKKPEDECGEEVKCPFVMS